MPLFLYKAMNASGVNFEGQVDAKDAADARAMLVRKRLTVVSVRKKPTEIKLNLGSGIKSKDIARFTRQFSAMCSAGLPMLQCLSILEEQADNAVMKETIHKLSQSINGGTSLADALALHPKIFNRLYVHMVAAGEAGGILEGILLRLAEYQEANERLKRKVKKAMTYPMIVLIVAIVVVVILLTFVIPQFAAIFQQGGGQLPMPTQIVMAVSDLLRDYFLLWLTGVVGIIVGISYVLKVPHLRLRFDTVKLKAPLFGDLETKSSVSRFCRTLGTLLNAGVSIIDALHVTAKTSGNMAVESAIIKIATAISGGKPIAEPMKDAGIFPPMVIQMTSVGERTGGLGNMLLKVADFYDEEVDAAVDSLTSMIEPLIVVFLGGFIGFILVAMYMPMFSMSDNVG
jgi:type IV pilus assembly protein PilC